MNKNNPVLLESEVADEKELDRLSRNQEMTFFLEEIVNGIIHEVNSPLYIIQGKALQLARKLDQKHFDQIHFQEELAKISAMSTRITKILTGLRALSINGPEDPMEHVDVNKIICDTLALCDEQFHNHSVTLIVKCHEKVNIFCRPTQISQIIINLLSNAYHAVECLAERWVSLEVTQSDGTVVISVTDSGTGIPPEIANKLAIPFFTTKVSGKGMGLGLNLSKRIAVHHKGAFRYDVSSPNTRFVLELPVSQNEMKKVGE